MTIKMKLATNAIVTAIGIIVIAGFSLSGMKFVQGKLHVLTEKSTPYQLKTIALQRSLQEHISNLLKITVAANETELGQIREEAMRSLEEVRKVSEEVAALKGGGGGGEKLQELEKITADMISTVGERVKADAAGKAADVAMEQKLARIDTQLQKISAGMKGNQKKTVGELSSTNDSVKRASTKNSLTQAVVSALTDMKNAVLEVAAADQKPALDSAVAQVNAATQSATKNLFMRTEKNTPLGKEITAVSSAIGKLVAPGGALIEAKHSAMNGEEGAKSKLSQEVTTVNQKITHLSAKINEYAAKINENAREEGKKFDKSLESSVMLSEHLAANTDLLSECSEIRGLIRDIFSARSADELNKFKQEVNVHFNKAATLLATKMKSVEGSGSISGAMKDIQSLLMASGGAADKQMNILQVNMQLQELNSKLKSYVGEQRKEGEQGISSARTEQENAVKSVNRVFRSNIIGVAAIGLAVLFIGITFSIVMGKSITKPISELSGLAERFGNGDFSSSMDATRKDEFGKLAGNFNTASGRLREIVSDLTSAIGSLKKSSDTLTHTSVRLHDGSQQQASQATMSATALEEVSRTIVDVANNAGQAANATRDSSDIAAQGKITVMEVVDGMNQIAMSVGETSEKVQKLGESSQRIGTIIDVINDIADQTNLLALNAAIEAARAGESGMGFAVVANEVRTLAHRTTEATREIEEMIKEIQTETNSSIHTMGNGKALVDKGVELARRAQAALETIVSASDSGAAMVVTIATASEEQAAVVQDISSGVERMTELTKIADADSELVISEARDLAAIAEDLSNKAEWFKF